MYEDSVQVPRLYISWPTVGVKHEDTYALSVLSSILSGPRTARLTKALVFDSQIAANIVVFQSPSEDVGEFRLIATPRTGHSLTEIETAVDEILTKFMSEGPTADEVKKATAGAELSFVRGLESNLGKAEQLISGLVFQSDPGYFRTDLSKRGGSAVTEASREYIWPRVELLSIVRKAKKTRLTENESETCHSCWRRSGEGAHETTKENSRLMAAMLSRDTSPRWSQPGIVRKFPAPGKSPV